MLFRLIPMEPVKAEAPVSYKYKTITINRPDSYFLSEPNAFVLDYAEYKFDDGEWQPKNEILKIDEAAFIITNETHNVRGRGFTLPNIDL